MAKGKRDRRKSPKSCDNRNSHSKPKTQPPITSGSADGSAAKPTQFRQLPQSNGHTTNSNETTSNAINANLIRTNKEVVEAPQEGESGGPENNSKRGKTNRRGTYSDRHQRARRQVAASVFEDPEFVFLYDYVAEEIDVNEEDELGAGDDGDLDDYDDDSADTYDDYDFYDDESDWIDIDESDIDGVVDADERDLTRRNAARIAANVRDALDGGRVGGAGGLGSAGRARKIKATDCVKVKTNSKERNTKKKHKKCVSKRPAIADSIEVKIDERHKRKGNSDLQTGDRVESEPRIQFSKKRRNKAEKGNSISPEIDVEAINPKKSTARDKTEKKSGRGRPKHVERKTTGKRKQQVKRKQPAESARRQHSQGKRQKHPQGKSRHQQKIKC